MGGTGDTRSALPGRDQAAGGGPFPPSGFPPAAPHLSPRLDAVLDDIAGRYAGAYEVAAWKDLEEVWTAVRLDDGGSLTAPSPLLLLSLIRSDSVRPVERRERVLSPQAALLRAEYRPRGWCVLELGGRAIGPLAAGAADAQLYQTRFDDALARWRAQKEPAVRVSGRGALRSSG